MEPELATAPVEPPKPQKGNFLVILLSILLILTILTAGFFYFQIQKLSRKLATYQAQTTPSPCPTAAPLPEKCTTDKDCPENTFCDYSLPGGMGPEGFVSETPSGSQRCIPICVTDDDCPNSKCLNFKIVTGDLNFQKKGCSKEFL